MATWAEQYGLESDVSQPVEQQGNNTPLENLTRGLSDVTRGIGLGEFAADPLANAYDTAKTLTAPASQPYIINQNMPNYDNPFRTKDESIAAETANPLLEGLKAGTNAGAWLLPWAKPVAALYRTGLLGRGAVGGAQGLGLTAGRGDFNPQDLLGSGGLSAAANVVMPPILKALATYIGRTAFGQAGAQIPKLVSEGVGGNPLSIMSATKEGVQNKAGALVAKSSDALDDLLGRQETRISGDVLDNITKDAPTNLGGPGASKGLFSNLDNFLQDADVDYSDDKNILTAKKFAGQAKQILQNAEPNAPLASNGTPQYSTSSWNLVKQYLQKRVNYDKVADLRNPAMKIAGSMANQVKQVIEGVSPEIKPQNAITGAAAALSKNAENILPKTLKFLGPALMVPEIINLAQGGKSPFSPYMQAAAVYGAITQPGFASSTAGTLGSQQLMGTLSSLLGSSPGARDALNNLFTNATTSPPQTLPTQ